MQSLWKDTLWRTNFSDLEYMMLGKPDSAGWAKFQCLSALERIREWNLRDMIPLNTEAREAITQSAITGRYFS